MGDGNCLFRSISFIINGHEDGHQHIRKLLAEFVHLNPQIFRCLVWTGSVEDHVSDMRVDGIWGTQVELAAAATYFQVPLFTYTPHPQTQHYNWVCFKPLPGKLIYPDIGNGDDNMHRITLSHIELCNTSGIHYDCVLSVNNTFPTECPQLMGEHENINIDIN